MQSIVHRVRKDLLNDLTQDVHSYLWQIWSNWGNVYNEVSVGGQWVCRVQIEENQRCVWTEFVDCFLIIKSIVGAN